MKKLLFSFTLACALLQASLGFASVITMPLSFTGGTYSDGSTTTTLSDISGALEFDTSMALTSVAGSLGEIYLFQLSTISLNLTANTAGGTASASLADLLSVSGLQGDPYIAITKYSTGNVVDASVYFDHENTDLLVTSNGIVLVGTENLMTMTMHYDTADKANSALYLYLSVVPDVSAYSPFTAELSLDNSAPSPVPVPGAVWLLGSGLLGLVGLRRRA